MTPARIKKNSKMFGQLGLFVSSGEMAVSNRQLLLTEELAVRSHRGK